MARLRANVTIQGHVQFWNQIDNSYHPADHIDAARLFQQRIHVEPVVGPRRIAEHGQRPGRRAERPRDRLPVDLLPSFALSVQGKGLDKLAAAFRRLPIPVIGRIEDQSLILDLRCLEDETNFIANLSILELAREGTNDALA